jgi:DGQHR domain-containing protein
MNCICCGLSISDVYHVTQLGNVCSRCWDDPNLFFSEKVKESGTLQLLTKILLPEKLNEKIKIPVVKLTQKNVTLYSGKLKAVDLLKLYAVLGFEEENLSGYQREIYEDQVNELANYILDCPIALMPGLFLSLRDSISYKGIENDTIDSDIGILEIPIKKGALWIIDGQHRIGGFEKILSKFGQIEKNGFSNESFLKLLNYDIPVTFVDSKTAINSLKTIDGINLNAIDIERVAFFIINKTQRRLSPSLEDALQYCITRVGIKGIPAIDREKWRAEAAAMGINLNALENSPLYEKINVSGQRGLERPIQLNSFISSLRPLYMDRNFNTLSFIEKNNLLLNYWNIIKLNNIKAFSKDSYRNYLLLKTIGFYSMSLILLDYIKLCIEKNINFIDEINIENYIKHIKGFDWSKQSSPLAGFGGAKGVIEARKILLDYISKNSSIE